MPYNEVAPIPKQMTIVVGLCVVGLMAFGLALSYYKNIIFDRQLKSMQERNQRLSNEIASEYADLLYYESEQYKDKYAKENFNLLRPGEKVVIVQKIDPLSLSFQEDSLSEDDRQALFEERLRAVRIIDQWKLYLFHRDAIDQFRKV